MRINLKRKEKEEDNMILNNKKEENRTITINNKNYYENELNETMRNSLIALSTQKTNKARLQIDVNNAEILILHHGKIVDEELAKIRPIAENIIAEDKTFENGKS
jgi:hypothetical protein